MLMSGSPLCASPWFRLAATQSTVLQTASVSGVSFPFNSPLFFADFNRSPSAPPVQPSASAHPATPWRRPWRHRRGRGCVAPSGKAGSTRGAVPPGQARTARTLLSATERPRGEGPLASFLAVLLDSSDESTPAELACAGADVKPFERVNL